MVHRQGEKTRKRSLVRITGCSLHVLRDSCRICLFLFACQVNANKDKDATEDLDDRNRMT